MVLLFASSHNHLCVLIHQQGAGGSSPRASAAKRKAGDDARKEAPKNRRMRRAPLPHACPPSPGASVGYLHLASNHNKPNQSVVLDSLKNRKASTAAKIATARENTTAINKKLTTLDEEGGLLQDEVDDKRLVVLQKQEELKTAEKDFAVAEDALKDNSLEKLAMQDELKKLDLDNLQWEADQYDELINMMKETHGKGSDAYKETPVKTVRRAVGYWWRSKWQVYHELKYVSELVPELFGDDTTERISRDLIGEMLRHLDDCGYMENEEVKLLVRKAGLRSINTSNQLKPEMAKMLGIVLGLEDDISGHELTAIAEADAEAEKEHDE